MCRPLRRRGRRREDADRRGWLRPPDADLGQSEQVGDSNLGFWGGRDATPAEPETMPAPAARDAGLGSQVPLACLPAQTSRFARDASIQRAELENMAAELTIAFECLGDAG